jgi:hypothetical protein
MLQQSPIEEFVNQPDVAAAIGAIVVLAALMMRHFLGPKSDWVESARTRWFTRLHEALSLVGGYATIEKYKKEYVASVTISEDELERVLYQGGYHRNLGAAKKYRAGSDGEDIWAIGSWAHRESLMADMQDHATLFPGHGEYTVDIYHHRETSWVAHPIKHYFNVEQTDGDPERTLRDALDAADVEWEYDAEWASE